MIGLYYGAVSGSLRKMIDPSFGEDELRSYVNPGEALLIVDDEDLTDIPPLDADGIPIRDVIPQQYMAEGIIAQLFGREGYSFRCAIIDDDTGIVSSVVAADPRIDFVDGATLIQDDIAVPGWVMGATELEPPAA